MASARGGGAVAANELRADTGPAPSVTTLRPHASALQDLDLRRDRCPGDPCVELFPIGPNTGGTSLNDAQEECEAARAGGLGWQAVMQRVVDTVGVGVIVYALTAAQDGPAQVSGVPQGEPAPTSPPYAPPSYPGVLIDEGARRMTDDRTRVTGYGYGEDADPDRTHRAVYAQCLRLASFATSGITVGDCETKPIFAPPPTSRKRRSTTST